MSAAQQEEAGLQLGRDYPRPIVDHKEMRQRALALYKAVKDNQ
jgi:deoxyribodipyrimidine photo-lyase